LDYTKGTFAADVTNARTAYNGLSTAQKAFVTNTAVLTAAEAGIVTDQVSLTNAIANVSKIFIKNGFTLTNPIVIDKKVSINGNGQTLTSPATITGASHNSTVIILANDTELFNLTVDAASTAPGTWVSPARFGVQVYDATGVKLTNITLKKGQAGLLVNAMNKDASVNASGIHTVDNGFGGIEVFAAATFVSTLTITGSTHSDAIGKPAIWSEGAGIEVVNAPGYNAVDGDATPPANGTVPVGKIYYTK